MKKGLTELVFILDRSGSMSGLENETIGGYNSLIEKQKKEAGEALISTILFDNEYELLHDRISVKEVNPITDDEYYVRGSTALQDAVGITIRNISYLHKHLSESELPEHVMFVITTDGMENASREYSYHQIRKMVEIQKEKYGWEFIFLGANIDALATARRFGINEDRAANYNADCKGTNLNYQVLSDTVSEFRTHKSIKASWKNEIEEDFKKRSHKK